MIRRREKVYRKYLKEYKFYLSFENAKCKDYITEKFFNVMRTKEAIPVALGGTSIKEYVDSAPPHSYLHVDEYSSIDALADKLEYLSKNETAYKQYFWWTEHYQVTSEVDEYASSQCDLCEKINLAAQDKKLMFNSKDLFSELNFEYTCSDMVNFFKQNP